MKAVGGAGEEMDGFLRYDMRRKLAVLQQPIHAFPEFDRDDGLRKGRRGGDSVITLS